MTGRIQIVLSCLMLWASMMTFQNENQKGRALPDDAVVLSLQTKSNLIEKGKPFVVTFSLENRFDKDIDINSLLVDLEQAGQTEEERKTRVKSYWTGLRITDYLPDDSRHKQRAILSKGERIEFDVDISKTKWGIGNQSGLPSRKLEDVVPKGNYTLRFCIAVYDNENDASTGKNFWSNEVFVFVE